MKTTTAITMPKQKKRNRNYGVVSKLRPFTTCINNFQWNQRAQPNVQIKREKNKKSVSRHESRAEQSARQANAHRHTQYTVHITTNTKSTLF